MIANDTLALLGKAASAAVMPILVLLGFAAAFWLLAVARFRWEEG